MWCIGAGGFHRMGGHMTIFEKIGTKCGLYYNRTIDELIDIYSEAKNATSSEGYFFFCRNLKEKLNNRAKTHSSKEVETVLIQYKIHAKSFIDNNLISFNLAVATILFTICGIATKAFELPLIVAGLFLLCAVVISLWSIYQHCKSQKLREIIYVLESKELNQCISYKEENKK